MEYIKEHQEFFGRLNLETGAVVQIFLNSEKLLGPVMQEKGEEIDMCKALEDLYADGVEQGLEKGEEYFAMLTEKLLEESRTEDLKKAAKDKEFREGLYREYGIGK